jgi:hypothetical protein
MLRWIKWFEMKDAFGAAIIIESDHCSLLNITVSLSRINLDSLVVYFFAILSLY